MTTTSTLSGRDRAILRAVAAGGADWDHSGLVQRRFGAGPGDALLLRPDQHLCARFRGPDAAQIAAAHARAQGKA